MMVEELNPSAGTLVRLAMRVDTEAEGAATWNTTVAVGVMATLSVTSSALKTTDSGVESETANVAWPALFVTAEFGEMVAVADGVADSDTDFASTGLPPVLRSVTVTDVPAPT